MSVEKMVPKSRGGDPDFPGIPELAPFQGWSTNVGVGMSEMVERVARAIIARRGLPDGAVVNLDSFYADARAAIEAMREPTAAMLDNAKPNMDSWSSNLEWWSKMIDGALR